MELDLLNGRVRVYNYNRSSVGFPSMRDQKGVYIRGRDEGEPFVVERVLLEDIEIENTKSDVFKVGMLRFHKDEEDEIYKRLGIEDRENIKTDQELTEMLRDNSIENLKKISEIKSTLLIIRLKNRLFEMERGGETPLHDIVAVVSERADELKYRTSRNENSIISKLTEKNNKNNVNNEMQKQLEELAKKVEQLEEEKNKVVSDSQTAITDLLKIVEELKSENKAEKQETKKESPKKTAGRPKKDK